MSEQADRFKLVGGQGTRSAEIVQQYASPVDKLLICTAAESLAGFFTTGVLFAASQKSQGRDADATIKTLYQTVMALFGEMTAFAVADAPPEIRAELAAINRDAVNLWIKPN